MDPMMNMISRLAGILNYSKKTVIAAKILSRSREDDQADDGGLKKKEATMGFEPMIRVLQTLALASWPRRLAEWILSES